MSAAASRRRPWSKDRTVPHYVYRYYDINDRLVYVGCSMNPNQRMETHRSTSWWFHHVASHRFTVFPNADYALLMERTAIGEENPRFNIKGRWAHRGLWSATDYKDYHDAIVMVGSGSAQQRAHAERVVAEAKRRYGIDVAGASA